MIFFFGEMKLFKKEIVIWFLEVVSYSQLLYKCAGSWNEIGSSKIRKTSCVYTKSGLRFFFFIFSFPEHYTPDGEEMRFLIITPEDLVSSIFFVKMFLAGLDHGDFVRFVACRSERTRKKVSFHHFSHVSIKVSFSFHLDSLACESLHSPLRRRKRKTQFCFSYIFSTKSEWNERTFREGFWGEVSFLFCMLGPSSSLFVILLSLHFTSPKIPARIS